MCRLTWSSSSLAVLTRGPRTQRLQPNHVIFVSKSSRRINYTQETAEPFGVSPPEAVDLLLIKSGVPGSPVVGSGAMVAVGDVPLKSAGEGVMDLIASDAVLDEAYVWLCDRQKDYSPHDDVWTLRERWLDVKPRFQRSLLRGEYRCDVTRAGPYCGRRHRDLVGRRRFGFEGYGAGAAEGTRPGVVTALLSPGRSWRVEGGGESCRCRAAGLDIRLSHRRPE